MPRLDHTITAVQKRAKRVRSRITGTALRPRVTIARSNRFVWIQAIDDTTAKVLATASDKSIRTAKDAGTKLETAAQAGITLAKVLLSKKISQVVFDRGAYRYHGRVAAVANALREAGIQV